MPSRPKKAIEPAAPKIDDGAVCSKCGAAHNPTKCSAHSLRQGGNQCHRPPMAGQKVCATHGGRARQAKQAAAVRNAEEQIRKTIGVLTFLPVDNPLAELQHLAGEARAWKEVCAAHVANLERMRYSTDGGEAIRGEVILFERAMDRCLAILATTAKLNIDERLARITEAQKMAVINAINAALAAVGVKGEQALTARQAAARHLRAVEAG